MKKNPIFLYVLLGLSALGTAVNVYAFYQRSSIMKGLEDLANNSAALEQINLSRNAVLLQAETLKWFSTAPALALSAFSTLLFVAALFFLFYKKDVVKSVYSYIAMRLSVFIYGVLSVLATNNFAHRYVDGEELSQTLNANKISLFIAFLVFIGLSGLAYSLLGRYQKALEAEMDDEIL